MIPASEVKDIAETADVPLPYVEKDYVMGWLLWGIYQDQYLANNLVLKGGNCLRKLYFADTRFSDDLDFTAQHLDAEDQFRAQLEAVCQRVHAAAGIDFDLDRLRVDQKQTPDSDLRALDGRVYFRGFAGDASVTMRIKFDVSEYERIVLPLQRHAIRHPYSDANACQARVLSYSLEEVLAEKLRSWIQRTRPRDLFDVAKIVSSGIIPISRKNVLSAFFKKTIYKGIPVAAREEMLHEPKLSTVEGGWLSSIVCAKNAFIAARNAVDVFRGFVGSLYEPDVLDALGIVLGREHYDYRIGSGHREAIVEAGRASQLIRLRYDGVNRDVEPYSFRYKVTKEGRGGEYFYGHDRTRGNTIKSFLLWKVQGVSVLPERYSPRWHVEL